ncbi:MAG: DUF2813 domain-containing protein [Candidatus Electrothrix sp. AU1_5]|nr:DUF2813 domain-containing protein [Candidatus Electrothrix gigas]
MFLSELRLWNFRKYGVGTDDFDGVDPGIMVPFNEGFNVLIGENDSGKTAIVDSIRHLLGTQSREWYRLDESDFYGSEKNRAKKLKIEAIFQNFTPKEAAPFLEWMGFEERNGKQEYVLTLRFTAERKVDRIITNLRAGADPVGSQLDGEARELLRITYLKPLRDAESELTPGRRSRLAQILAAHKLFQKTPSAQSEQKHKLEEIVEEANTAIKEYFSAKDEEAHGYEIMRTVNGYLEDFFSDGDCPPTADISISGGNLGEILRRLSLELEENPTGLGSLNLLYIATELLLLQSSDFQGLRLGIVEELEAHLHPQAQLRLIDFLEKQAAEEIRGQFILTTHSTTMGASIDLKNLLICRGSKVFPMAPKFTDLYPKNYDFLHRFLDATKANLLFARGVILVEGAAENLLVPVIAEIIDRPLQRYGVSIINVGSTAFLHYAKIFSRKDGQHMDIPVAVVTDMDVKPLEWEDGKGNSPTKEDVVEKQAKRRDYVSQEFDRGSVKAFLPCNWTLEYDIALDPTFTYCFYESVLWAEKLSNAKTGEPQKKKAGEVWNKVQEDIGKWEKCWDGDSRKSEKIAFEIYHQTMLGKDISKAITAQVFAEKLANRKQRKEIATTILNSERLKYLVDAICYVTKPRDTEAGNATD